MQDLILIVISCLIMVLAAADGIDALKGVGSSFRTVIVTLLRVKITVDVTNDDGFNIEFSQMKSFQHR